MPANSEENSMRMAKSQLRLLDLIQRCLSCPWEHIVCIKLYKKLIF